MNDRIKLAEARFWNYVAKLGDDDCWLWTAGHFAQGYGSFHFDGRSEKASRFSWMLHFGEIPGDKLVCHHCDTPSCVNPKHLFVGTIADNNHDRDRKGRGRAPTRKQCQAAQALSVRIRRRFTEDQIRGIRTSWLSGTDAAKYFSTSPQMICFIRKRRIYQDVQ